MAGAGTSFGQGADRGETSGPIQLRTIPLESITRANLPGNERDEIFSRCLHFLDV